MSDQFRPEDLLTIPKSWLNHLQIGYASFQHIHKGKAFHEKFEMEESNRLFRKLLNVPEEGPFEQKNLPLLFEAEFPFKLEEYLLKAYETKDFIKTECDSKSSLKKYRLIFARNNAFIQMYIVHLQEEVDFSKEEISGAEQDSTQLRKENIRLKKHLKLIGKQYNMLAETSPLPILIHTEGVIAYVNQAAIKTLGAGTSEAVLHKSIWNFVDKEYHQMVHEQMKQLHERETTSEEQEEVFYRMDGSKIHVMVTSIPVHYHGKSGVKITFRDITEQKRARAEEALIKKRFEHFMENIPAIVLLKDADLHVVYFNQYFRNYFYKGEPMQEMVEEDYITDDPDNLAAVDKLALKEGKAFSHIEMIDLSGNYRVFRSIRFSIPFGSGTQESSEYLGVISWDITNQYKIQKRIRRREANYRIINENISDIIYSIDSAHKIQFLSGAVHHLFGTEASALIGYQIDQLPVENEVLYEFRHNYLKKFEEAIAARKEKVTYNFYIKKEKQPLYLEINERNQYDENGNHIKAIGTIRDVTNRALAEEKLKQTNARLYASEQRHKSMIQNLGEGILILSEDTTIELANTAAEKILGYTEETLKTKKFSDFLKEKQKETLVGMLEEVSHYQRAGEEIELSRLDNKVRYVLLTFTRVPSAHGEAYKILGILRDITYRKYAEMQMRESKSKIEESDKLKSIFLQNISHEVRTPINAIVGFSDLLTKKNLDAGKQEKFLNIIKNSTQKLLGVMTDILDNSKLQANETEAHFAPADVNTLIREVYQAHQDQMHQEHGKSLQFELDARELTQPVLKVDETKIRRVLDILLENARKFTDKGRIVLTMEPTQENNQYALKFQVKDTGIGIPPEKQKQIFEPFLQAAEEGTKRLYGGMGLGLSTASGLVKVMGGHITVRSEQQKGAVFTFIIPAYQK